MKIYFKFFNQWNWPDINLISVGFSREYAFGVWYLISIYVTILGFESEVRFLNNNWNKI